MIYAGAKAAGNTYATAILTAGQRNMPAGEQITPRRIIKNAVD